MSDDDFQDEFLDYLEDLAYDYEEDLHSDCCWCGTCDENCSLCNAEEEDE